MWLYVGYGTLWGALVGVTIMFCATLKVAWTTYRISSASGNDFPRQADANIYFVFALDGALAFFREEPLRAAFMFYGIPVLTCAIAGFIIENVMRLF